VVASKLAEAGGKEFAGDVVRGIVLGVVDDIDHETGEHHGRVFEVLDDRSGTGVFGLVIMWLPEALLDLDGADIADHAYLRRCRRRLHQLIGGRLKVDRRGTTHNPPTDTPELAGERAIQILLRCEESE
jgi:hypothetical protein